MLKKLGNGLAIIALLALIGASGYFVYEKTLNPCDRALKYEIGRFDTEFGITEAEFKIYLFEAEEVWERALNKNVFSYEEGADFKVNLVYDERQLATLQKQRTEFGLSAIEEVFKKLDQEFNSFKNQYESRVSAYEKALAIFQSRKAAYEAEVQDWNSRGGLPAQAGALQAIFESLEAERHYLNSEALRLNTEASAVNQMGVELNTLLKTRNNKASEYNQIARDYNKRYDRGLEFNQAEYNGQEINVYQYGNKKDLILALTHEFGHALGLEHVDNPDSIMYYLSSGDNQTSLNLTPEDLAELQRVCKIQ
ncbi:MAG: matrixin family metalloprotease [Candidatus Zambryskibacteria bacterium]|nr:matrixin family metalloprotease [Candidatus Zambryskibacteria bacterium]